MDAVAEVSCDRPAEESAVGVDAAADLMVHGSAPARPAPEFILMGPNGFLGSHILRALEAVGHRVVSSRVRLQDRLGIEKLLDDEPPSIGVICAAGERGRPNISWCESHPVETVDANVTGQLNVAAACYARGLHATFLGTGALYSADERPLGHRFKEEEPPNATTSVYSALRQKLEELLQYFDNALVLRVLYPVSSNLEPGGLLGKLARFRWVDPVATSVTVLEDLLPLLPELSSRRVTGVLNFVNRGTVSYRDIVAELGRVAPAAWERPEVAVPGASRPACELDVARLESVVGTDVPDATASLHRIIGSLREEDWATLPAFT